MLPGAWRPERLLTRSVFKTPQVGPDLDQVEFVTYTLMVYLHVAIAT